MKTTTPTSCNTTSAMPLEHKTHEEQNTNSPMTNKSKTAAAATQAPAVARNSTWTPTEHTRSKTYTALRESLNTCAKERANIVIAFLQKELPKYNAIRATAASNSQNNKDNQ